MLWGSDGSMHVKADDVLTCSTQLTMQTVRMAAGEGLGRGRVCVLLWLLSVLDSRRVEIAQVNQPSVVLGLHSTVRKYS